MPRAETHQPTVDKRIRTKAPHKCTECNLVLRNTQALSNHLQKIHQYSKKDAQHSVDEYDNDQEGIPTVETYDPKALYKCPYCPIECNSKGYAKHLKSKHPTEIIRKRARAPPRDPGTDPPVDLANQAPQLAQPEHKCPIFAMVTKSKKGLTMHALAAHALDLRQSRAPRPPENRSSETAYHILFECPRLSQFRRVYGLGNPGERSSWFGPGPSKLLRDALNMLPTLGHPSSLTHSGIIVLAPSDSHSPEPVSPPARRSALAMGIRTGERSSGLARQSETAEHLETQRVQGTAPSRRPPGGRTVEEPVIEREERVERPLVWFERPEDYVENGDM